MNAANMRMIVSRVLRMLVGLGIGIRIYVYMIV